MRTAVLFILALLGCQGVLSFMMPSVQTKVFSSVLRMGGGRSPAEKTMSKRNMYKDLRSKFNEAAKLPGFFDVGEGPPEIELYCKSNKDGKQIGDCPFTQFVQLVMLKKGIRYTVHPTLSSLKPDWLVQKHAGAMPAIVHKGVTMTDSMDIAEYLEKSYPHCSLTRHGVYSYQEVLEKTSGFFPALSAFVKNKDATKDAELGDAVEAQLDIIDGILRSTPGYYLCGVELTLADLYLAPQLFHATVAMDHFKQREVLHIEGDPVRPALEAFMTRMFDSEEFNDKRAYYSADQVIYGWKVARGEAQ